MKSSILLLSSIVVVSLLFSLISGRDVEPDKEVEASTADIEDKVVEVMDVLEDQDDEQPSDHQKVVLMEEGSQGDAENDELIEEAQDNKFTFWSLFHGRYYQSYYQKINDYLVSKLEENDNSKDNMVVALEWIDTLERAMFRDTNLIKALKQFTALTKLDSEQHKCTKNAYGILHKNDLATKGRAHKRRSKLGAMRRVDKIVYYYSINHAIDCFHEYPRKFAEKRAQMDQTQLSHVELLFDHIFQTILKPTSLMGIFSNPKANRNNDPTALVRDIKSLDRVDVGEASLDKLRHYARNDPDIKYLDYVNDDRSGKYIINDKKVKELFEKYIVKPCEYYIEQLGFNILIPMRFDLQMLEPEDRYLLNDDETISFYIGYAKFRACNLLVYQNRRELAERIVKAVRKQSQPVG